MISRRNLRDCEESAMTPTSDCHSQKAIVEEELNTFQCMKENKSKKKSGGFQSMGLSFHVLKGVLRKGYKVPTPIQRKSIPVIMEGQDVVAMARTGSGKTAAFLIPLYERLKSHSAKVGARALIFSPTRELAIQTMKFTKEIGKFTDLKASLILGGEKMEEQFAAIHENPDIIIATPGRFLHLVIEMDLKLTSIEYIVFDEADRLFEMGFQAQLEEVLHRLPENHQTLLFSATLPCILVDFVKAGLTDPVLIRLDVDLKLSVNLKTYYLCCRSNDKPAILIHLLKTVINVNQQLTVVFLATRHHVEYIKELLDKAHIPSSYIYSSLDQTARKINVAKFKAKKASVLLVTDIAARGIDIPLLDNVINYNFPSKPKLFVHRVGRVARAGRSGNAYSLVAPDEMPFLLDLHLFMGKPVKFPAHGEEDEDGMCGFVPQNIVDEEADMLRIFHETSDDLQNMATVCHKAYKQYVKSRSSPSSESVKRAKEMSAISTKIHPMFNSNSEEMVRRKMLSDMKNYRSNLTIFEVGATAKSQACKIMRLKRIHHSVIDKRRHLNASHSTHLSQNVDPLEEPKLATEQQMSAADDTDIMSTFTSVMDRKSKFESKHVGKLNKFQDAEYYVPYHSREHYSEKGLGLQGSFEQQAGGAVLDLTGDDAETAAKMKSAWHWDRKRKRFIRDDGSDHQKKIKTESGVWIPKSYKSDIYKKWVNKTKVGFEEQNSDLEESDNEFGKKRKGMKGKSKVIQNQNKKKFRGPPRKEIKSKEEILKQRKVKSRKQFHQKKRQNERSVRRPMKRKH